MTIATGVNKQLAYKKETAWGVLPTNTGGKLLRRVTGTFDLTKEAYESGEIRSDYQVQDFRHGVRKAEGTLSGELSPGSYADFFAAAFARAFTAGATSGTIASLNLNATTRTMTRSAGSFLTDGFKIGDVVRATGFTTPSNNARNLFITALTATILTYRVLDGGTLTTEATATNVTIAVIGKKTYAPLSGHTDDSFTFEEWFLDIAQSEVFTGNKVNTISLDLPPSGLTTVEFGFMGKDLAQTGTSQFFTTPTALGTSGIFAAVNGALIVNGLPSALVTGLSFNINRNMTSEAVVGSNTVPDIFEGRIVVEGEFTAFFEDGIFRDYFINETEIGLAVALTTSNAPNADVISFMMPRIKVNSAGKDDGEKGLVRTFSYRALLNSTGGAGTANEATTISMQDSLA